LRLRQADLLDMPWRTYSQAAYQELSICLTQTPILHRNEVPVFV